MYLAKKPKTCVASLNTLTVLNGVVRCAWKPLEVGEGKFGLHDDVQGYLQYIYK
jgi:hypothetical protein